MMKMKSNRLAALSVAATLLLVSPSNVGAQSAFSEWSISSSNFTAAATLSDKNTLILTHGAGDGGPTLDISYYYDDAVNKTIGSPILACKSRGGVNSNTTTGLDLSTAPLTTCNGTPGTDSECTTTIEFGFGSGIGDSEFYIANASTATIQLCLRFTLQDIVYPRSEWCSSDEQSGVTLNGYFYQGQNEASICEDLCRDHPACNTYMTRDSQNRCFLSNNEDLIPTNGGGGDHPFLFGPENCIPVPEGEKLDVRSGEFAFEWSIDLGGDIVTTQVFDAVDDGAETITASGVVQVEAFACDAFGAEIVPAPTYAEGSTVYSCVRSSDAQFHVVDIDQFTYVSPNGIITQNAVLDGGFEAALSVKDCTLVVGECQVATLLVDAFYSEDGGTIEASGVAVAEAPTTRRRLVGRIDDSKRHLEASMETFDMQVQLAAQNSHLANASAATPGFSLGWMGVLVIAASVQALE